MNFDGIEMIPFSAHQQLFLQQTANREELLEICNRLQLNEDLTRLAFELRGFSFEMEDAANRLPGDTRLMELYSHYLDHINANMGRDVAASLNESLLNCWSRILHRTRNESNTNYGLVVGRIQSGKTAHLLGLSSLFLSQDYDTLVILAGGIDDLRHQVMERVEEINFPDSVVIVPNGPDLRHNDFARETVLNHFNRGRTNAKLIIIIKKHISHINCLTALIRGARSARKRRRKVLVVDDECDYASRDNNHAEGRERPLDPEEISPTNKAIRSLIIELRSTSSPTWYIGYTATPFANLLIQEDSSTEDSQYGLSLYPRDFIFCLPQPENHRDNEYYFLEQNQNVRILDDPTHENYSLVNFQHLILLHFVSYVIKKRLRGIEGPHMSLIHTDILTREHRNVIDDIETARNSINNEDLDRIKERLLACRIRHYPQLSQDEALQFQEFIRAFDGRRLKRRIREISFIELNRRTPEEDEVENHEEEIIPIPNELKYPREDFSGIVVGGTRVSRGLTIKGLTLTWFTRSANEPSYDTMLQQARWCGYRTTPTSTYADLVRIFTESQIHNQFHTISLAELDLRSQLEAMDDHVDPIEQRIYIQRHDGFKITGRMPPRLGPLDIQGEIAERNTICQYPSIFRPGSDPNESNSAIFQTFSALFRRRIETNRIQIPNGNLSGYILMENIRKRDIQRLLQAYFESYDEASDVDTKRKLRQILNRFENQNITSLDFWNVAVRDPHRHAATHTTRYNFSFSLVNRGFTEDGYAGRVWSGVDSSIIDLEEGEVRTRPLLLIYLANPNYEVDGRRVFPTQPNEPVLLFHIILPSEALGQGIVRVQRYREEDW